ncbi:MAG: hypothetical protein KAT05_10080 [Spirochaetes bacterium]|nr:hypothetical protein [Spirochaetota bacterium]
MGNIRYYQNKYLNDLTALLEVGINLRTEGGSGSHIGPVYVARKDKENPLLIAPLRDKDNKEGDEGRLLIEITDRNTPAQIYKLKDNTSLIHIPSNNNHRNCHIYKIFEKYIDSIHNGDCDYFARSVSKQVYLRKWDDKLSVLTFPKDPR